MRLLYVRKTEEHTHLLSAAPLWTVSPVCLCLYPSLTSSTRLKANFGDKVLCSFSCQLARGQASAPARLSAPS